jgi:hypothetical protein
VAAVLVVLWLTRRKRAPVAMPSSTADFSDEPGVNPDDTTTDISGLGFGMESPLFLRLT